MGTTEPIPVKQKPGVTSSSESSDHKLFSQSFGGGEPSFLSVEPLQRHVSSDLVSICYSGYLLKRSNEPCDDHSPQTRIACLTDDIPALPVMPGKFAPKILDNHYSLPRDIEATSFVEPGAVKLSPEAPKLAGFESEIENRIQKGLESAAAFFGIELSADDGQHDTKDLSPCHSPLQTSPMEWLHQMSSSERVPNGSLNRFLQDNPMSASFREASHRRHSAPLSPRYPIPGGSDVSQSSPPPQDYVDSKDGHLWRAKYCVLEDGILYFYRNRTDGESAEARRERQQLSSMPEEDLWNQSSIHQSTKDLSKSPMARGHMLRFDSKGNGNGASPSICMWEKRVFLDCVGAVRYAEHEYGSNSFQLQGIPNGEGEEEADSLILQAHNQDEMKEWIFQFHRSLATFMRNIMDAVGSSGSHIVDENLAVSHQAHRIDQDSPSDKKLQRWFAAGSRFPSVSPIPASLSHGHGRVTVHRRRPDSCRSKIGAQSFEAGELSIALTPETAGSGCFSQDPNSDSRELLASNNIFRMSPVHSPSESPLLPPMTQNSAYEGSTLLADNHSLEPHSTKSVQQRSGVKGASKEKDGGSQSTGLTPTPTKMEQEQPKLKKTGRYVPPHLRKKNEQKGDKPLSLAEREKSAPEKQEVFGSNENIFVEPSSVNAVAENANALDVVEDNSFSSKRGGCADPKLLEGSILDPAYVGFKTSKLGPVPSEPFGSFGGCAEGDLSNGRSLRWETGAVSECGVRDSNEDAYLIVHDLVNVFRSLSPESTNTDLWSQDIQSPSLSLFAVFDGHCGNEAARFAAEKLVHYIHDELLLTRNNNASPGMISMPFDPQNVENCLREAIQKLDVEFCELCQKDGREWQSGATALVAMIVDEHLIVANLGDCRGVLCRFVGESESSSRDYLWNELDSATGNGFTFDDSAADPKNRCLWKEITTIHSPSSEGEKKRIEAANGWVSTETEIPIGQLRRMDFLDEDVIDILKRCFNDRFESSSHTMKECKAAPHRVLQVSRVCSELAVSRALGDRDFKSAFNGAGSNSNSTERQWWDCPLELPYPENHSHKFVGDLVSNCPEFEKTSLREKGVVGEFLLLACDGLWDVMDADDAVRVTQDLLFRKQWTAKRAAARLAELAIHLGSSDNVTVILVRFFQKVGVKKQ